MLSHTRTEIECFRKTDLRSPSRGRDTVYLTSLKKKKNVSGKPLSYELNCDGTKKCNERIAKILSSFLRWILEEKKRTYSFLSCRPRPVDSVDVHIKTTRTLIVLRLKHFKNLILPMSVTQIEAVPPGTFFLNNTCDYATSIGRKTVEQI